MVELGWKLVGLLEFLVLLSVGVVCWEFWVRGVDVLLVNGGDVFYLVYWMCEFGLVVLLLLLECMVWVGLSVGSMVMVFWVGEVFIEMKFFIIGEDWVFGVVDFLIFLYFDYFGFDENIMVCVE